MSRHMGINKDERRSRLDKEGKEGRCGGMITDIHSCAICLLSLRLDDVSIQLIIILPAAATLIIILIILIIIILIIIIIVIIIITAGVHPRQTQPRQAEEALEIAPPKPA